ncbi:MAG TPA: FIST N-terminal domain-containing protein [Phnomibacter sp.]|nr:FIST N-terminal domain-containing protein [Phnomibacter sp.]
MKARSIQGRSLAELNEAIEQSKADGFRPTLAFVFSSAKLDIDAICALLEKEGVAIFGASTSGEFIDGYQGEGSAAVLLLDIKPEHFTILFEDVGQRNEEEVSRLMGQEALLKFKRPAFIIAATGNIETDPLSGEQIIKGLEGAVGKNVSITGGLAGNDMEFSGTRVFTKQRKSTKGIMMLVLDEDNIEIHGLAVSGWNALGTVKYITRVENDWIRTIDNEPALDVYLKYMGRVSLEGERAIDSFFQFSMAYPFQVQRANGSVGLCTPVMFNKTDRSIQCEYPLAEGTAFRFSVPPDFDIVEEVIARSAEVKDAQKADADALLVFSCIGRLLNLGPMANEELEGLHTLWNAPMAGFYTYGEFGRAKGEGQEFHSTTISWVTLKEK